MIKVSTCLSSETTSYISLLGNSRESHSIAFLYHENDQRYEPVTKVTIVVTFEFSRNTQSWQRWHFCTTFNVNKLETVRNLIMFSKYIYICNGARNFNWCDEFLHLSYFSNLERTQKCQHCQLCVLRENSIATTKHCSLEIVAVVVKISEKWVLDSIEFDCAFGYFLRHWHKFLNK